MHKTKNYKLMVKKRGLGKMNAHYASDEIYDFYKEKTKRKKIVSKRKFTEILKEFNKELVKLLIFQAYDVTLPGHLGHMSILKYKPKISLNPDGTVNTNRLAVNQKATRELWERDKNAKANKKLVFHMNEHSDGYTYKWLWDTATCNVKNHSVYKFVPSRRNKRLLSSTVRNKLINVDYLTR